MMVACGRMTKLQLAPVAGAFLGWLLLVIEGRYHGITNPPHQWPRPGKISLRRYCLNSAYSRATAVNRALLAGIPPESKLRRLETSLIPWYAKTMSQVSGLQR